MRISLKQLYRRIRRLFFSNYIRSSELGHCETSSRVDDSVIVSAPRNLYMYEHTNIDAGAVIMNTRAKFIMKKYSGAAIGLTVITGAHMSIIGKWFKQVSDNDKDVLDTNHEYDKDVIVEEDVWIASNVTIFHGVTIGRGAIIGGGSVIRTNIPPYAILTGNPAKIVGFKFAPHEVIEHEKRLYSECDRLPLEILEKNYTKYFINRINEIKTHTRL